MQTYLVLRRHGWPSAEELEEATARAKEEESRTPEDLAWIRSYDLAESNGDVGMICVYRATSPEAIRAHARRAELPVDEIVKVADTLVVRPDPVATTTPREEESW